MSDIRIALVSLGCAKNLVDSEMMLALLAEENFILVTDTTDADAIIVNTCGFIESAKQESIEKILELAQHKQQQCRVLLAAGCLAQRYGAELLAEIPELDGIFGTNDVHAVAVAIRRSMAGERVAFLQGEYDAPEDAKRLLATASHMAYLKIAEGCDNNCTYCAIPAIRGHYRSRGRIAILAEAQQLAAAGVKEISLIAQDITLYGLDRSGQLELPELLEELVSIRGIEWIRLLYAYPERLDTRIIDAIARMDKVCNYLDLPLQHGVDRILHRMGRKLTVAQIVELLDLLRTQIPGISLRSSFIVGFPGETEHDFQKLLEFLHIARLDRTGFFVYSQEEGTAAARFHQQVPESIKQERLAEAIGVQSEIVTKKQQALVGQQFAAMVDGRSAQEEGVLLLRTYMQAPEVDGYVRVPQFNATPGTIVRVTINGFEGYDLLGKVNLP